MDQTQQKLCHLRADETGHLLVMFVSERSEQREQDVLLAMG